MKLIKDNDLVILAQEFTDKTKMWLEIRLRVEEKVAEKIALLKAIGSLIEIDSEKE